MKEISIYCITTKLCIKYHDCVTYLVALEKAVRSRSISTSIGFNCILSLSSSSSDVSFSLYGSLKQQCYTIITIPNSAKLSSFQMLLPIACSITILYTTVTPSQPSIWRPPKPHVHYRVTVGMLTTSYLHPSFNAPPFWIMVTQTNEVFGLHCLHG